MARSREKSPEPSHFDKLADTSVLEGTHRGVRKGELERPGNAFLERARGIKRSSEDIIDSRGKKVGDKHIRRRKIDSRMSEARAEFARHGVVNSVVLSEYETSTGEMKRHERQTPDGETLRIVERHSSDYYTSTDFDSKKAGDNPVSREEFDAEGVKLESARMKYTKMEVDGEEQFLIVEDRVQEFIDGNVSGERKTKNNYDKSGRVLERSTYLKRDGEGKIEYTDVHKYEDEVEFIESSREEYSQDADEALVRSSVGDKKIEEGLLTEETKRFFDHGQERLSETVQELYKRDPGKILSELRERGRKVAPVWIDNEKVLVEITKELVKESNKSFRYDESGRLTGDTETVGEMKTESEYGYDRKGRRVSSVSTVGGEVSQEISYQYGRKDDKAQRIIVTDNEKSEVRAYRRRERSDKKDRDAPEAGYVLDVREDLAA